jgi:hypothetical protein
MYYLRHYMSARAIWSLTEDNFPARGSSRQKLEFAARYAALAPAKGHLPLWNFRVAETQLELIAKDPLPPKVVHLEEHQSMIACGAALLYLKLALKHFGCLGEVALFPELDEPRLVARIRFGSCRRLDPQEQVLFEAMNGSPSHLLPGCETPFSEAMLAALSQAVAGERGWLDFIQSEMNRKRVMEIVLGDDQVWMNFDRAPARQTNPAEEGRYLRWPRRLFAFGGRNLDSRNAVKEPVRQLPGHAATFAVVKSKTDDKHGWLAAGQTMARTILQAQALGLSWEFFNPMRRREAREALRVGVGRKGFAQVILRFGSITVGQTVRLAASGTALAKFR